jgi:butyrate kinase
MNALVLALDPAEDATGMALFRGAEPLGAHVAALGADDQRRWRADPRGPRVRAIREFLSRAGVSRGALAAVVATAGRLRPVESGTYAICDALLKDAERAGDSASLGAAVAHAVAAEFGCPAFVVDPESVDDRETLARLAGGCVLPPRAPALAMRAAARRHARAVERPLASLRLVVAQVGARACVGALRSGRIVELVDVWKRHEDCLLACAAPPPTALADHELPGAFDDAATFAVRSPGSMREIDEALARAERGDTHATLALQATAYRLAKATGALAAVLEGEVDAVLLAGRLATAGPVVAELGRRVEWIAPVFLYCDDDPLHALAEGALRVLRGEEPLRRYA